MLITQQGRLFAKKAYEKDGVTAIKKLLNVPPGNEKLKKILSDIFDVEEIEMDNLIKEEILTYQK